MLKNEREHLESLRNVRRKPDAGQDTVQQLGPAQALAFGTNQLLSSRVGLSHYICRRADGNLPQEAYPRG
jgi:hypothetical protein